jgi:site-specific DNA recombinase
MRRRSYSTDASPSRVTPQLRCAIYTRVSSDQGLEQDFNSLDAQREAAEAYVKSQAHEGWRLVRSRYDDGGYSGGSMERPALQELLADIQARLIDVIVVYKVDRLTRSLADFAKLVELFDANSVSFVSVTQSFNTTTSMGRLTLNILLSFAQFEREVTGERIRDKIAASKKKGMWVGGVVPLGYRVKDKKLLVDEAEAETVRHIFDRYLALGSLPKLIRDLDESGIRSRRRTLATGRVIGGVPLTLGPLGYLLRNRMYLGEINHRGKSYPGEHPPILTQAIFDAVQAKLEENMQPRHQKRAASEALLLGKIFDDRGNRMTPSFAVKQGVRYRYYASCVLAQGRKNEAGSLSRIPAPDLEAAIVKAIQSAFEGDQAVDDRPAEQLIDDHVQRVVVSHSVIEVAWLLTKGKAAAALIRIPWTPLKHPRLEIILSETNRTGRVRPHRAEARTRLLASMALGRRWLGEISRGDIRDIEALAEREAHSGRSVRTALALAFLSPRIAKCLIEGRISRSIGVAQLFDLPISWDSQHLLVGV